MNGFKFVKVGRMSSSMNVFTYVCMVQVSLRNFFIIIIFCLFLFLL